MIDLRLARPFAGAVQQGGKLIEFESQLPLRHVLDALESLHHQKLGLFRIHTAANGFKEGVGQRTAEQVFLGTWILSHIAQHSLERTVEQRFYPGGRQTAAGMQRQFSRNGTRRPPLLRVGAGDLGRR